MLPARVHGPPQHPDAGEPVCGYAESFREARVPALLVGRILRRKRELEFFLHGHPKIWPAV
jgi:hypothetical protein